MKGKIIKIDIGKTSKIAEIKKAIKEIVSGTFMF